MKVCIAEKPSVAREIAQILKADQKRNGYFEGNGYQVTWTFGHFCTLFTPDDYHSHWKRWDLNTLPMLPEKFETRLIDDVGIKKQFSVIKNLFQNAEEVINCGDAGQEGELIQRWVIKQANYNGPIKRLWISSLTSEAIESGFNALKDSIEYDNLYYAGGSRAIGDWLLGMNATRLYTLKYGGKNQVLSIGRVQTPTLAMIVQRYHEISNFKPEPYWELQTTYRDTVFNHTEGKFTTKSDGEKLMTLVSDKPFKVVSVSKKKGREQPPRLFDLTGLQVYCNNKFGFSADQTLKIVQKLYESKVVTYPRVDTTFLPDDVYPKIGGILKRMNSYSELTQSLLTKKIKKSTRVFNDKKVSDHHAIIPTGYERSLGDSEHKVYDAIARHFIAVFYPDCEVSNTAVDGEVEGVNFKTTGKEILKDGWRVVFEKDKKDKNDENILPVFKEGESGPHEPSFLEKMTKAPRNYTEASLLRAMETAGKQVDDDELRDIMKENGIGRPSTRAAIIETLFKRKYIKRNKKLILPTEIGIRLIGLIDNELLKSAELTGQWEKKLREIEEGSYSASGFIKNMKAMVNQLVTEVRLSNKKAVISSELIDQKRSKEKNEKIKVKGNNVLESTCPKCAKGNLLKGNKSYGCSRYNEGCDFRLPFVFLGKKISENQIARLLKKGSTVTLKGFKQSGKKVNGSLKFDDSFNLVLKSDQLKDKESNDTITCPKCNSGTIIKGKSAFGCSNWNNGCDFTIGFDKVHEKLKGNAPTKERVHQIIKESYLK